MRAAGFPKTGGLPADKMAATSCGRCAFSGRQWRPGKYVSGLLPLWYISEKPLIAYADWHHPFP